MEEIILKAEPRKVTGHQVKALRRAGRLPAVIYGRHIEPQVISLDHHQSSRILPVISSSHLIKLSVAGDQDYTVLVRQKQHNPLTGSLTHIDFLAVSLSEKLRASVTIELVGLAPAVKNYNGVLVGGQEQIEVECLPGDLPERIEVDMTKLQRIGDGVYVRDLKVSDKVEVLTDLDEMVILVTAPSVEGAVAEAELAPTGDVEVIDKGKKEEENF
jgi:large subunit ribosomal protein L25